MSSLLDFHEEENPIVGSPLGRMSIVDLPASETGYKWQTMECRSGGECTAWVGFNASTPNFKIDGTPPTSPGDLELVSTDYRSAIIQFGDATEEINFSEYKIWLSTSSPVLSGSWESDDSNLDYIDYNSAATTTITGLQPDTLYYVNIWAYDIAGNSSYANDELSFRTKKTKRARTVEFLAGQYSADGGAGADTEEFNTLPAFNFSLAEDNVKIENAYIILDIHLEAYANYSEDHTGYELAFDACDEACSADASSSADRLSVTDDTALAYREGMGSQIRILQDVTDQIALGAYAGSGAELEGQIGYKIKTGSAAANSISNVTAKLVVTYTFIS